MATTIHVRAKCGTATGSTATFTLQVFLREDDLTLRATLAQAVPNDNTYYEYSYTLSESEEAAITGWSNLVLGVEGTKTGTGANRSLFVSGLKLVVDSPSQTAFPVADKGTDSTQWVGSPDDTDRWKNVDDFGTDTDFVFSSTPPVSGAEQRFTMDELTEPSGGGNDHWGWAEETQDSWQAA
jgi:hypothetical protein